MKKSEIKQEKAKRKDNSDEEGIKEEPQIKEEEGELKQEEDGVNLYSGRDPKNGSKTQKTTTMKINGNT